MAQSPQARQWKRWIGTRDEDQVHLGRLVREQERERGVDPTLADVMNVVQHEHKRFGQSRDLVDQSRHGQLDGRRLRGCEQALRGRADLRVEPS